MANQGLNIGKALMAGLAALALASCDMMHDDMDDCVAGSTQLRVDFKYDMNLKWADAFEHEVKGVTLYAYDGEGNLAYEKTETAEAILGRGGYMDVDGLAFGRYTLMAWAEGEQRHADTWTYGQPTRTQGEGGIKELYCRLNHTDADIRHDLTPLFHGLVANADLTALPTDSVLSTHPVNGIRTATVPLMKNTNTVRVVLQQTTGETLNADDYSFAITDDNGYMDYDNTLLPDDKLTYHEWAKEAVAMDDANTGDATAKVSAVVAELTTARLVTSHSPRLTITNTKTGERILSIPLIDYALLVKGNYNKKMDDQEYLDRQDEYNFIFFLTEGNKWLATSIFVNSWRVVLHNESLGE